MYENFLDLSIFSIKMLFSIFNILQNSIVSISFKSLGIIIKS